MDSGAFFVALFLTAFVYLMFPVVYVMAKGKVNTKKGKKFALLNSFICAGIFFFITVIIITSDTNLPGGEIGGYSLAPAFLYYFIAKAILTDKNLQNDDGNFINGKKEEPQEDDTSEEEKKEADDFDDNI